MTNKQKYEDLELLRGVAAVGVMVYHFVRGFAPAGDRLGTSPLTVKAPVLLAPLNGPFLVAVFFVLSSYALTARIVTAAHADAGIAGIIKRAPRLFPVVFAGVMLPALLWNLGFMVNEAAAGVTGSNWLLRHGGIKTGGSWPDPGEGIVGAVSDSLLLFWRGASAYNSALWTMKFELVGSVLALATAVLIAGRLRPIRDIVVVTVLGVLGFWIHPLCGLCVATVLVTKGLVLRPVSLSTGAALAVVVLGLCLGTTFRPLSEDMFEAAQLSDQSERLNWAIHCTGAMLLFLGVHLWRGSNRFSWAPARVLGNLSFSIYVLHVPIIGSVASLTVLRFGFTTGGVLLAALASLAATLALAVPLAYLDSRWVAWLNIMTRRILPKRDRNATVAAR